MTGTGSSAVPAVVACVHPVDLRPVVDPLDGTVTADTRVADLAAPEAAAVEYALRVAEARGARVRVVMGGAPGDPSIVRELAGLGADVEVVDVGRHGGQLGDRPGDRHGGLAGGGSPEDLVADEQRLAAVLARAIEAGGHPGLVLCGDRSPVRGTGALGAFLAHELGMGQALGLVSLAVEGDLLVAERRLEGGWRERLAVRGPAVCSVEGGIRLRRAPLASLLDGSGSPAPPGGGATVAVPAGGTSWPVAAGPPRPYRPRARVVAAPTGGAHDRLVALTAALVAHDPPSLVGPVGADAAADAVLAYLSGHGYPVPTADPRPPGAGGRDEVAP